MLYILTGEPVSGVLKVCDSKSDFTIPKENLTYYSTNNNPIKTYPKNLRRFFYRLFFLLMIQTSGLFYLKTKTKYGCCEKWIAKILKAINS